MTIREAASDYRDEIRDGIAYVAIWQPFRNARITWCARSFWADGINDDCDPIFSAEDIAELREITKEDPKAI